MTRKVAEQITTDWCTAVRMYLESMQGVATMRHVPRAEREALGLVLEGFAPLPSDADKATRSSLAIWRTVRFESARASLELALYVEESRTLDDETFERRFLETQGRARGLIAEIVRFARETVDPLLDGGQNPTPLVCCDEETLEEMSSERVTCPTIYNESFLEILKDPTLAFEDVDWSSLKDRAPQGETAKPPPAETAKPPPPHRARPPRKS